MEAIDIEARDYILNRELKINAVQTQAVLVLNRFFSKMCGLNK